jgi:cation:H+ antiporter
MALNICLMVLGIILLYGGSEFMVRGAASLALSLLIRPIIVGLTVVAFATSAPELLVSVVAAVKGSAGVSLGNILGSNVANIGLVLGTSALARPLEVDKRLVHRELPYMIAASGAFWLICLDGHIGRIDGGLLLAGLGFFLVWGIVTAKDRSQSFDLPRTRGGVKVIFYVSFVLIGMSGLLAGANLVVKSAIFLAGKFGLSEVFIGLSIVAVGTSLPELAASVVAGIRGEHDISVGNVVGSNIFNICMVMGTVGLFNPMSLDRGVNRFEFPVMFLLTLALLIFCRQGNRLSRPVGGFFMGSFLFYVAGSYWLTVK